jgi:CRISPR-associated endonuclease Csy4
MEHYLEIRLLPDPEFPIAFLMSALYSKLHRLLVQHKDLNIGISFPNYQCLDNANKVKATLGDRLRLHGLKKDILVIVASDWLVGMRDHVRVSDIYEVPLKSAPVIFKRVQAKSNIEKIRRRYAKRHPEVEDVDMRFPSSLEQRLDLPFVRVKSQSTGEQFRLYIKKIPASEKALGEFSKYGLSATATVPLF